MGKTKLVLVDELQGLELTETEKGYSWYPYRCKIYAQNIDDAKKIAKKILKEYKKIFKKHGLKVGADNSRVVERQYMDRASKFWLFIAFEEIRLSKKLEKIHKKCWQALKFDVS